MNSESSKLKEFLKDIGNIVIDTVIFENFCFRKLSFKTYEERKAAAEKICKESEQMGALFHKYTNKVSCL